MFCFSYDRSFHKTASSFYHFWNVVNIITIILNADSSDEGIRTVSVKIFFKGIRVMCHLFRMMMIGIWGFCHISSSSLILDSEGEQGKSGKLQFSICMLQFIKLSIEFDARSYIEILFLFVCFFLIKKEKVQIE